jgi:hypothetical protein
MKKVKWIHVIDRLPENEQKCDVFVEGKRYVDYYFNYEMEFGEIIQGFLHKSDGSSISVCEGVYWMPVIKPKKMKPKIVYHKIVD